MTFIDFLRRLFGGKPQAKKKSFKLAIVLCHNDRAQGAFSETLDQTERAFYAAANNSFIAAAEGTTVDVKIFRRMHHKSGYMAQLSEVYGMVDEWGADAVIEPHFNAANGQATGTETFRCLSDGGLRLAKIIHPVMVQSFGLRDRGIKTRLPGQRGGGSVHSGNAPALLLEPAFGDNPSDARALRDNWARFARAVIAELDGRENI